MSVIIAIIVIYIFAVHTTITFIIITTSITDPVLQNMLCLIGSLYSICNAVYS